MSLRDKGNEKFKNGEYKDAEELYTQAIHQHPTDQRLFSNRALTRLRLRDWSSAETDARKAIELYGADSPTSMKPHFYLAQALLELRHTTEAMQAAQTAYKFCLDTKDSSTETVSRFVLKAKQGHWRAKETTRLRDLNQTLGVVEDLLGQQLDRDLQDIEHRFSEMQVGETGRNEERDVLFKEAEDRRKSIRAAFTDSSRPETVERVVPDWLVDAISFEVMHDPVVTPSGHSYEKVGLLRHVRKTGLDPLTRQPLREDQLITNHALRDACSEFLENNGWAVDW